MCELDRLLADCRKRLVDAVVVYRYDRFGRSLRPRRDVDADKVATLRAQGATWREIAARLGVGIGTVHRVAQGHSRNDSVAATAGG